MDSLTNSTRNPSFVPTVPGFNQSDADLLISSLISFPDSSIDCYFDRALDKALSSVSVQDSVADRTLQLASVLLDSTKRCIRKRASIHNSKSWLLPPELTIKVFSMLDTKSLMQAAACCTMFNNCAMDRLAYAHIDLTTTTNSTDNEVVCTMIHRAGKELRSLKLGRVARTDGSDSKPSLVKGPFLSPLSYNHGFLGSRLKSLRLYNLRPSCYSSLIEVLSVCSNLTDLRIVGLNSPFMHLFETLMISCRLIEHLCLETCRLLGTMTTISGSPLIEYVTNSPNLTSLTLIRFRVTDEMAQSLAESSRKLKYLNLSRSPTIKGRFLRDLGHSCKDSSLKTLILRNCPCLLEEEVMELCNSLLKGNFKSIQHIDVSSNRGLISNVDNGNRSYKPNFPLEKLKEERSDVTFVADFPLKCSEKCYRVCDGANEEELRLIEIIETENDEVIIVNDLDDEDDEDDDDLADVTSEDDSDDEEDEDDDLVDGIGVDFVDGLREDDSDEDMGW